MSGSSIYSSTMDVVQALTDARTEIANRGACQRKSFDRENGHVCSVGALRLALCDRDETRAFGESGQSMGDRFDAESILLYNMALDFLGGWNATVGFNDQRFRTDRAILKRFDQAIAIAEANRDTTEAAMGMLRVRQAKLYPTSISEYVTQTDAPEVRELQPA